MEINNNPEAFHIVSPLIKSDEISNLLKNGQNVPKVYLKLDNIQPSGSFKIRGIGHLINKAVKNGYNQLISSSGGNAGLAATYAACKLKIPIKVIVPESTPQLVIDKLKAKGAYVTVHGAAWDEADIEARRLCASTPNTAYVHPFDDPLIWNGNSTIIDEIKAQINGEKPDCIIASVGGGGLFCGIIEGMIKHDWMNGDIDLIAVETVGADCFNLSVKNGTLYTLNEITSVAKTLGAKTCAKALFDYYQKYSDIIKSITVTDSEAIEACCKFLDDHRMLVEASCGASLAVAYNLRDKFFATAQKNYKKIVVIICGGSSVNLKQLQSLRQQFSILN